MRILRRPSVLIPVAVTAAAVLAIGLYLFQPWRLFTNVTVDEALPVTSSSSSQPVALVTSEPDASPPAAPTTPSGGPGAQAPTDGGSEPRAVARGRFISHEHGTSGTVRVLELADGSRVLRIEGLDTDNGPDLKVWLAAAPVIEETDGWFVFDDDDYVDLGPLKGNRGNQNYRIPADVDLDRFGSVTIWCDRFSVSFGAAALLPV